MQPRLTRLPSMREHTSLPPTECIVTMAHAGLPTRYLEPSNTVIFSKSCCMGDPQLSQYVPVENIKQSDFLILRFTLFQLNEGLRCMIFTLISTSAVECLNNMRLIFFRSMAVLPVRPPMAPLMIRTLLTTSV